jgi:hypothetical protein
MLYFKSIVKIFSTSMSVRCGCASIQVRVKCLEGINIPGEEQEAHVQVL